MLVTEKPGSTDDVFERTDNDNACLSPATISEAEVRRDNGWNTGALVPRWMGMPAH